MEHNTEVVKVEHISDTQIAVTLRCCADDSTASVHTIEVSGEQDDANLQEWLNGRHAHVQGLHEKRERAKVFFEKLKVMGEVINP